MQTKPYRRTVEEGARPVHEYRYEKELSDLGGAEENVKSPFASQ